MKRIMLSVIAGLMLLIVCVGLSVPALAAGREPIAENLELSTYRDTSVNGKLSAYDPEDDVASYEITTKPIKGEIKLEQNGDFVYTPLEGKKGRDYFGYKAIDSEGNMSQEATVIIRIEKQKKSVVYNDMEKRAGEYAAVKLNKAGIFTGEKLGTEYYFSPDKSISRNEFTRLCMLVSGNKDVECGELADECSITRSEAALILDEALELNDINYIDSIEDRDVATVQACMNLSAVDILSMDSSAEDILTREAAAIMLVQALELMENR